MLVGWVHLLVGLGHRLAFITLRLAPRSLEVARMTRDLAISRHSVAWKLFELRLTKVCITDLQMNLCIIFTFT